MRRNKTKSRQAFDARFWSAVETQDTFWRGTFVNFVRPLKGIYADPISAGAFILSQYLTNPAEVEIILKIDPAVFGALAAVAPLQSGQAYRALILGRTTPRS